MPRLVSLRHRIAITIVSLAACSGGDDGTGPPLSGSLVIARAAASGDGQSAPATTALALPLRVRVTREGVAVRSVLVTWTPAGDAGSTGPTQSLTGTDGVATTVWSLGATPGAQGLQASIQSSPPGAVTFSATAVPDVGPAAIVELFTSGTTRFAPGTLNVIVGTTVSWIWRDGFHDIVPTDTPTFPGVSMAREGGPAHRFTFTQVGSYSYYCTVHGTPTSGMRGTVVVQ